jgi:hypothetical protein
MKRGVQNKPTFILPDQVITVVNFHTKFNVKKFSIGISQGNKLKNLRETLGKLASYAN